MNLSLSNLAWNNDTTDIVLPLLKERGITQIEGVLTKLDDWDVLTEETLFTFKKKLDTYDIKMKSIQSIFYNLTCTSIKDTEIVYKHILRLLDFCKILGIEVMVFGSPNMRKGYVDDKLAEIFSVIDNMLDGTKVEISIEPNSKIYGGDYFYNLTEITEFISKNNYKNIKTMIDTHNLLLEGYNPSDEFLKYKNQINHIHISEVNLKPISDHKFHKEFSNTLKTNQYQKTITYEVNNLININTNINTFIELYNIIKK